MLGETGLELKVVPNAVVLNREQIGFADACRFIHRQFAFSWLHLNARLRLFGVSLLGFVALTALEFLTVMAFVDGDQQSGTVGAIALAASMLGSLKLIKSISREPRRVLQARGEDVRIPPLRISTILTFNLTFMVSVIASICATVTRYIIWRGIRYRVRQRTVEMVEYKPFVGRPEQTGVSI